ncbi:hypothetical protein [Rhodospirillum centenum]|uniref:Uncharacterized protein n=1 Tax=Rhodospirillum centenum (strain ATCC 51521 / SW) TaxID=414684 RepID=B6IV85_RHOCS|nr:hypothetical protein [Rhodospirillum centenum]ACJ00209.1 hypothetical protein RC1_2837 [Rhodospirillum centenum SW]
MTLLTAEEFLPSTFAERGVAVPFTTPLLNQARLRQDRNERFEFLLPSFTGGKGIYVMPWKSLPSVMTVTLHDRLLFEEIERLETHSPETIRGAALRVQATGVAGPDAAAAARRSLTEAGQQLILTQFILVTELLKLVGIGARDLLRPGMTAQESQRLARQALAKVAALVKIPPDDMAQRVETLGTAIAPVGMPQSPQPGRLRALLKQLDAMRDALMTWAQKDASDVSGLGDYVADIAGHTIALGAERLKQLDLVCGDPKQIIHDEPRFRAAITQHVSRLSWLLDGWDFLIALWNAAQDRPEEAQRAAVVELSRLVPVIPREELGVSFTETDLEAVAKVQRRWVRMNEDWRTGALDMDAVMRLESLKTAAA